MRTLVISLTAAILLFAAPAMASDNWANDMPRSIENCLRVSGTQVNAQGLTTHIVYVNPGMKSYAIKTQDGKRFDLLSGEFAVQPSVPLLTGAPLFQVKKTMEEKCE
ncbi:hypothetical protein [Desulfovibrio sp. JC010]|uniref:hypothetical protein n=1 Tax=Desulfovibrio sp. JC010 TaxID=2593641 RepID=UPI0013D3A23A|nr:hypothetical protein [Desulfovibrio sp. JC010]NDV25688.1 hypothetical protein [Desulfovibrio sp. JC010]